MNSLKFLFPFLCVTMSLVACDKTKNSVEEDVVEVNQEITDEVGDVGTIEIKGSDSEVNAVQRMAEAFMAKYPDIKIAVTGGGSGAGIASLIDGTIHIANASRPLASPEKIQAVKKGVKPVATVFATDALSIAVHPSNPVKTLSINQLGKIFRGEATDWSEFGGQGKITAYGRQPSSGTYVFFRESVVKGDYGDKVMQMNGNAQIVESIAGDPGGIGYVAVGYISKPDIEIKALAVSEKEGEAGLLPTNEVAVAKGQYPIARPLFQYTNGEPKGSVRKFIEFELSADGSKIAKDMGFYPVRSNDAATFNVHMQ